ncbi:hypothetical protein ACJIZ3_004923 [Penstemon smallii]|uniref:Uncharacterized protein n=1 Tax=Penstemon smallii TaxID=265156 RepID=A0ABD3S3H4_9LAMI
MDKDSASTFVKINSLSIDLNSAMDQETESRPAVHEHFSIRGYVAGMRDKDPKICLPFSSNVDEGGDVAAILQPLHVPSFQWWQCSGSCIPSERSTVEMAVTCRGDTSTNSCDHNLDRDKYGLSLQEDLGNKHGSRDSGDGEDNGLVNAMATSKMICYDGPKATESSKDKTEEGNAYADMIEVNRLQIRDRSKTTAGASGEPSSFRVEEPEYVSSGSEKTPSPLPQKRKPKLRSLADILVEEKNPATESPRPRIQATSTETEALTRSQNQLNVPVDTAKGIRSKPKRKITREEDREVPSGNKANTNGEAAKRLKGPSVDPERTRKRVDQISSDTESDSEVSAKIRRMKPKKCRSLDINKKMTRAHTDERTPPVNVLPNMDSPSSANIQKHAIFGKSGETGPNFRSFLFGQQMGRMTTLLKNNRPEVEAGPSKITLGDSSGKGKVALDLSLNGIVNGERSSNSSKQSSCRPNNRAIPDLNETFTHTMPINPERRSSNLERAFNHQRNLDISASKNKFSAKEVKRQLEISDQQAAQKRYTNIEQVEPSEMAIVELLARNKRETEIRNLRKNLQPVRINSSTTVSPPPYANGQPDTINIPFAHRTSVPAMDLFSTFPVIPFHHRKPQHTPSSSTFTGPRSSGLGGPEFPWRPRSDYTPIHFQNRSVQINSTPVPTFSEGSHKGKTISDIKGIEERRAVQEQRIVSNSASTRSFDNFSNDTIPAMQLLSMMNQRVASTSTFEVGSNKGFLNRTYHPRVNGTENRNFVNSSFFTQDRHSKDVPGSSYVGSSLGLNKASYNLQGQRAPEQRIFNLGGSKNLVIDPALPDPPLGNCTMNRNPADFSVPNCRNKFTLTGKDLEALKERAPAEKRQRVRKDEASGSGSGSGKEYSRK